MIGWGARWPRCSVLMMNPPYLSPPGGPTPQEASNPRAVMHNARQAILFFLVAVALTFSLSVGRELDIDEHGFIASGALMARNGLLPYRDYHYNHMPTEVMIYAALFRLSDHLLLVARSFQALCAACM